MFRLVDGVAMNKKHPTTFEIPTPEEKAKLDEGDYVKLGFKGPKMTERMWVEITTVAANGFVGRLDNIPFFVPSVKTGDLVVFNDKHILSVWED